MSDVRSRESSASPTGEIDPCMAAGIPGPEHEVLKAFEGTWNASVSYWMKPGEEPIHADGTMVNEWVLGNRFLQQRYTSDFMGTPFEGLGLFGYNNVDGRYEGLWGDTMSTGMMIETGKYDPGLQIFTMIGSVTEPASKNLMRKKTVITIDSPNQHTMSMHFSDEGIDTFWKCMEIVYTRS